MNEAKSLNVLGALSLAIADEMKLAASQAAEAGPAAPAALALLLHSPGRTIDWLSGALDLSHSATVRLADRLEAEGWLARGAAGHDGRAVALTLTADGKKRARAVLNERRKVLTPLLRALTGEEKRVFAELLDKLIVVFARETGCNLDHVCRLCDESDCPERVCPLSCAIQARAGLTGAG
ncbi:MAG TPA: MarR family winged helix-turn-helix transcriptional regulator [Chthoniobacterales bacterium]